MTPAEFLDKWSRNDRTERQAAQEHFIDLCRVLGEATPNEAADPDGYTFEKGLSKIDGTGGFADVWKRGAFGWEYKKDRANLDRAYQQLQLYSVALENPPLLVVSDTKRIRIYTNWTNTVQEKHEFPIEDLTHSGTRELLRNVFRHPEKLQPRKTREQVTKDVAKDFSAIAERLRMKGHAPDKVAHFLNRIVFCLFAEDVNLLQDDLFKRMLDTLAQRRAEVPERSQKMLSELFANMRAGGEFGLEHILHFNGGLFDSDEALPLDADALDMLRTISKQDWSSIDPTIFGTLFERFLDPDKRAQIGAHYTDPKKIMMIVEPVILRPLNAEWEAVKAELTNILSRNRNRDGTPGSAAINRAEIRLDTFLNRLADVRVLDPACGSGNFLYLALQSLKDLELRIILHAETMGMARRVIHCGPHNVKGIEINPYAAELARTSIWIGNIQWMRRNGFEARKEPVLEDLQAIECRDALVTKKAGGNYEEALWPGAEFIVGNPPFLGTKKMLRGLSENEGVAFIGVQKTGPFDLPGEIARPWLTAPVNPNGRTNSDVLRPYLNGSDITRRSRDVWIIDFGANLSEQRAALFELPFEYARTVVKPVREKNKEQSARELWWRFWRPRPELTRAALGMLRVITTPRVAKHRLFIWSHPKTLPDSATVAIARDDDTTFGILHSRFHESWSLRLGTWLGVGNDPRYTPTTTFETFPFPEGLTPNIPAKDYAADPRAIAIAKAAKRLDELRNAWLNPPDLIDIVPEVVPGYPDRTLPKNEKATAELKKRTLTNLYNARPQWLADAHRGLDAAVATAYGWPADISKEDALARLLELNLARSGSDPPDNMFDREED